MRCKRYTIFNDIIKHIANGKAIGTLDTRPKKYKFGVNNYGEIPGFINRADGDPWDIVVPGYPELPTKVPFRIKKIDGIVYMPNGNHKLIAELNCNKRRAVKEKRIKEINTYARKYNQYTGIKPLVIFFS